MKQNQPHVVIRPRKIITRGIKSTLKRKYVTLQSVQQQHQQKMKENKDKCSMERKRLLFLEETKLTAQKEIPVKDVVNNEEVGDSSDVHLSDNVEMLRAENIKMNNACMAALGLHKLSIGRTSSSSLNKGKDKMVEGSKDYQPDDDNEEEETQLITKGTKNDRKNKQSSGPTTRSQSNLIAPVVEKEVVVPNCAQANVESRKEVSAPSHIKQLKRPRNEGIGSMAVFLAFRGCQQATQVETEMDFVEPCPIMAQPDFVEAPIDLNTEGKETKFRGKTRMVLSIQGALKKGR